MFYSTFWLVVVAANLDLTLIVIAYSSFMVVYLLGEVVMSLINDKSHFAKTLLLIG